MSEVRKQVKDPNRFAQALFRGLPSRYDRLAEVLSMGQNGRWRRAMVDRVLEDPWFRSGSARVLDVASGTAGVAIQLARRSGAVIVGVDLTLEMLGQGRLNVAAAALDRRVGLVAGRAEALPFPDASFDALTFTYLLRYVADPAATLRELARVVKPGAPVASLDFYVPPGPVWRPAWRGYTRLVLPVAGLALGGTGWWHVGRFLGPNIEGHYRRYPLEWIRRAWEEAGFEEVGARPMSLGGGLVMWGRRAGG